MTALLLLLAAARWEFRPPDPDVRRLLCGRWHMVEVELTADPTVTPAGRQKLAASVAAQVGVKRRIAAGELCVVTQLNADGTYTHEVVSADESQPFPVYRETGRWEYDVAARTARRTADTHAEATLGRATVTAVTPHALVLTARLGGESAGITEVVRLRRFREPAAGR